MHPSNELTVNVVEGAPLEDFSPEVSFASPAVSHTMLIWLAYRLSVPT
jgi:hypothetical protein